MTHTVSAEDFKGGEASLELCSSVDAYGKKQLMVTFKITKDGELSAFYELAVNGNVNFETLDIHQAVDAYNRALG